MHSVARSSARRRWDLVRPRCPQSHLAQRPQQSWSEQPGPMIKREIGSGSSMTCASVIVSCLPRKTPADDGRARRAWALAACPSYMPYSDSAWPGGVRSNRVWHSSDLPSSPSFQPFADASLSFADEPAAMSRLRHYAGRRRLHSAEWTDESYRGKEGPRWFDLGRTKRLDECRLLPKLECRA
jgi:hypothetical protein